MGPDDTKEQLIKTPDEKAEDLIADYHSFVKGYAEDSGISIDEAKEELRAETVQLDKDLSNLAISSFYDNPDFKFSPFIRKHDIDKETFLDEAYLTIDDFFNRDTDRVRGWRLLAAVRDQLGEDKWARRIIDQEENGPNVRRSRMSQEKIDNPT